MPGAARGRGAGGGGWRRGAGGAAAPAPGGRRARAADRVRVPTDAVAPLRGGVPRLQHWYAHLYVDACLKAHPPTHWCLVGL